MAPKSSEYINWAHQIAAEKKTHVSFPQLNYPSLRDEGFPDPVQWLKGKAMDDGAEGMWRIHNRLYDFTDFVEKHPGGEEWLELTKGTDITEAFEAHHINPVVDKILEKYYIKDATTPRNSPFTFKEDGFYKSLKRAVREELKKIPPSESRQTDMIIGFNFAMAVIMSALACWFTNRWLVWASYLIASVTLTWTMVGAHNYLHMKTNWRMYLFNLGLWSYRDFRVTHVLSHHLYPNTLMDIEISAFEPLVFWNPRHKPVHAKLALFIELAVFPFLFIINFSKRFLNNFIKKDFFRQHYRWHDGIGFLLPIWMYLATGAPLYTVITTWLWIVCSASFMFFMIGINAAHHHPKIFKDGDQVKNTTVDWGLHGLEAVMDRTDISGSHFIVMTFFGEHVLHHMFPTLDHAILTRLHPLFLEYCEKFKANYRATSSFELFLGQLRSAAKENPNVLEE